MEARLRELQGELQRGQQQMALLERERSDLHDTMLRISGAIQVLEELLAQRGNDGTGASVEVPAREAAPTR